MKNSNFSAVYIAALVIGAILVLANSSDSLYQTIVIIVGVLFLLTSGYMLLSAFLRKDKTQADGTVIHTSRPWYLYVVAAAGIALGIWLLCMPGFFVGAIVYTFGVLMVIVGFLQVLFIYAGKRQATMSGWWYLTPWLVIAAGFVVIFMGPARLGKIANVVTGIALVIYGLNGLLSMGSSSLKNHKIDKLERKEAEGEN